MDHFFNKSFLSLAMLAVALQGCGNGASDGDSNVFSQPHHVATDAGPLAAIMVPTPRQAAARTPDASSFLNWAEVAYPNYFPPAQSNKTLDVWTYRYYPQTDIYLGTNTSGDVLGLHGKGNGAYDSVPLGKIGDFGCSVYPSDCAVVSTLADLGGPTGVVGNTLCLNADLMSNIPLYTRIESSTLGTGSIESPNDAIYTPQLPHIAERADGAGGSYLVFSAIEPTDINTGEPQDRSRTEIKVSPSTSGPHTAFQAHEGDVFVYSWRFFIPASVKFSTDFSHVHQLQGHGDEAPIITFTLSNKKFVVRHIADHAETSQFTSLATVPIDQVKGRWISVREEVKFSNTDGYYRLQMDAAGQSQPVISIDTHPLSLWRTGSNHARPKWGIYRKHAAELNQNATDEFWFSNIAISRGSTPDSTCRRTF